MSDGSAYQAKLQRGELLRNQNRYPEAEGYLQEAVAEQPDNPEGYYQLAFCYCNWSGHGEKALEIIDRALALDPNRAEFYALWAWVLGNLKKPKDAIVVADHALSLNPHNLLALNGKARAYSSLSNWTEAEATARHTLSISPRNEVAANLLAQALRHQGRLQESDGVTARVLAQSPDNALAQSNAGWSALQAGDHRRANQLFLEALRLQPGYDHARRGLLHSFSSRVWIYRIYFQFISWMGKHTKGMRYLFLALIYVVYRLVIAEVRKDFGDDEGTYWVLVVVAIYFILFGFGRSFGNLFLLLDPFARHALTPKEKRLSIFVGIAYGLLLAIEILGSAWMQTVILVGILAFFLWSVLAPRFQEAS